MKVLSSLFTIIFAYFVVAKPVARADTDIQAEEAQVSNKWLEYKMEWALRQKSLMRANSV